MNINEKKYSITQSSLERYSSNLNFEKAENIQFPKTIFKSLLFLFYSFKDSKQVINS